MVNVAEFILADSEAIRVNSSLGAAGLQRNRVRIRMELPRAAPPLRRCISAAGGPLSTIACPSADKAGGRHAEEYPEASLRRP